MCLIASCSSNCCRLPVNRITGSVADVKCNRSIVMFLTTSGTCNSTVELHVPEVVKNITIERLHFTSATLPVIRFTGKRQQLLEQLAIRHIQFDVTSRDHAVLQLSGLFVDDLQITGDSCNGAGPNLNVPRISIEMSEEASLRGASLTCLPTSAIDLAVARRPGDPNLLASITIIQSNLVLAH